MKRYAKPFWAIGPDGDPYYTEEESKAIEERHQRTSDQRSEQNFSDVLETLRANGEVDRPTGKLVSCGTCGRPFRVHNGHGRYCSAECFDVGRRASGLAQQAKAQQAKAQCEERAPKVCVHCNSTFIPHHALAMYCSDTCHRQAYNARSSAAYHAKKAASTVSVAPAINRVHTRACVQCGSEFMSASRTSKYCSLPCKAAARAERERGIA